jgi:hypothetical protein
VNLVTEFNQKSIEHGSVSYESAIPFSTQAV